MYKLMDNMDNTLYNNNAIIIMYIRKNMCRKFFPMLYVSYMTLYEIHNIIFIYYCNMYPCLLYEALRRVSMGCMNT
jgi:hypothetical protein